MNQGIQFTILEKSLQLDEQSKIKLWVEHIINAHQAFPGNINFIFCDDAYLAELNQKYLKHKSLTDIITFNYNKGHLISGDVFISIERVKENAGIYNTGFQDELKRVMIHGILHLLGMDDKTDAGVKKMRQAENAALKQFAFV